MRAVLRFFPLLALCGCAALPHDGPSGHSVPRDAVQGHGRYALVDLDYAVTQQIATHPPVALVGLSRESSEAPTDLIAEGDVLGVSVLEAGAGGLFGRSSDTSGDSQQSLPKLVVDGDGAVFVPFAGLVHVAGLTPRQAGVAMEQALRKRAVNPQVSVAVLDSRANSVLVIGAVRNAGHVLLTPHNDRLLDVLASAGGPTLAPANLAVVVQRAGQQAEVSLTALLADSAQNIRLAPQDQIRIVERPRKYSTFGAFGHAAQVDIGDESLTLAGAMSRAGGMDTYTADAGSVLVFRFERPEVATALGLATPPAAKGVPVVYRLNFLKPESLFVAGNFEIRADDLIYVPRSDITEMQKFFTLINTVTQIGYNVRVVGTVP